MVKSFRSAIAALGLLASPVIAADPNGLPISGFNSIPPSAATYDDGTGHGQVVSATHPMPTSGTFTPSVLGATSTDISGTVTTGNSYQTVIASSGTRKGCLIQNPTTAAEVLSVKVGTMAAAFTIAAGSTFSCSAGSIVVTDAITLTAATTGHAFSGTVQ